MASFQIRRNWRRFRAPQPGDSVHRQRPHGAPVWRCARDASRRWRTRQAVGLVSVLGRVAPTLP